MKLQFPFTFHLSLFTIFLFTFSFSLFTDNLRDKEFIVYNTYDNGKILTTTEQITTVMFNNEKAHEIKLAGSDGGWARIYLKVGSLLPLSVSYYDRDGLLTKQLIYNDEQIQVKLANGQDQYAFPGNHKDYYDMNSFFHLMRGFPIQDKEITFWSFLPEIKRGFLLYAKNVGAEDIIINKKEYYCYKIEVGAAGLIESTLFPQKFYFWITTEEPRRFLQFEGKDFSGNLQRTVVVSQ
jgi:hypothetical protein